MAGDWKSEFVRAGSLKIHVTRTGGDKPPLVLAHGLSDDGLCWSPVARELEDSFDVIMVDARGHGRSDAPQHGFGAVEQASDLHSVIAALGLHHPAILGHSMGAATTMALAGTYPDVPGAILLEDPPPWWSTPLHGRQENEGIDEMRAWLASLSQQTASELITRQRIENPTWSEAELEPWADAKIRMNPAVVNILEPGDASPVDWPPLLRRITCPALLITADPESGALVTEGSAAELKELIPQLRMAHIAGAGHSIRREQMATYLSVVKSFLMASAGP